MDKKEAKQKAKGLLDEYIETNKCRKTPERYVILDAVSSMRDPFTLEDLDRKLSGELRFPVSRATLYNTMNLFVKLRIVMRNRVGGRTFYEFCVNANGIIHQVCSMCGKMTLLRSTAVEEALASIHYKRFRHDSYAVYVYGTCSTCQTKITKQKKGEKCKQEN